jgi:ribosomal protein S18 acetylase RimI-like enzyme
LIDFVIRQFTPGDLLDVIEIEEGVYGSGAYRPLFLRQLYDLFPTLIWVAEADGRIVGHLCGAIAEDRQTGWIVNAGVLARYRRQGIGRALLERGLASLVAEGAERVKITADESNEPAIRLYKNTGFQQIGMGADYYGDGRDRLIFEYKPQGEQTP